MGRFNQLKVLIMNWVLPGSLNHKIGEAYQPAIVKWKWYILGRSKGIVNYWTPLVSNATA